ncbi:MAG: hypothetical protein WCT32_02420 [Patescibacteria group bacterium]|jgi:hypothetical protein
MVKKISVLVRDYPFVSALVLFSAFWFLVFVLSGSLFSGFHYIDDHEIIRIKRDLLSDNSFWKVASAWIREDLYSTGRFRPFYFFHRVLEARLFGDNFVIWSLYTGLLATLTSSFMFVFAKKIGLSMIESALFVLVALVGVQASIWWRLGPNETIGMFFLSASLLLAAAASRVAGARRQIIIEVTFVISAVLMSMSKESFVLLLPFIVLARILIEKILTQASPQKVARHTILGAVLLLVLFGWEIWFIRAVVGTDATGYAGVDSSNLGGFLATLFSLVKMGGYYLVLLIGLILAKWSGRTREGEGHKFLNFSVVAVFVLAMLPQAYLYAKSGVYERYLLPGLIGMALAGAMLLKYIRTSGARPLLYSFVTGLIIVCLVRQSFTMMVEARVFAFRGKSLNESFRAISSQTGQDDMILVAADPAMDYEASYSIKQHLDIVEKRSNSYIFPLLKKTNYSSFDRGLIDKFSRFYGSKDIGSISDKSQIKLILIFPGSEATFLKQSEDWFDSDGYKKEAFGEYIVFVNN